jgi:hypothetical protein
MIKRYGAILQYLSRYTMRNKYYIVNVPPWEKVNYIVNLPGGFSWDGNYLLSLFTSCVFVFLCILPVHAHVTWTVLRQLHQVCNRSNTTGATCGAGTAYPSGF